MRPRSPAIPLLVAALALASHSTPEDCGFPLAGRFAHNNPARVRFYESWLRHKMDVVMAYTETKDWSMLRESPGSYRPWTGAPYRKIISVPMLPDFPYATAESRSRAIDSGAAGSFDSSWAQFAGHLKGYGLDDAFIRVGWEANCVMCGWAWAPDSAHREAWIGYWRRIVTEIRKAAPRTSIVWCLGRDFNDGKAADPNGFHDSLLYPGDGYVDVIGMDTFDSWPPARNEEEWQSGTLGGPSGLGFWSGFAKRRGKPFAIPEWGLVDSSMERRSYGGDSPFYIRKMFGFITDPENRVLFQVYTGHFHGTNPMDKGIKEYRKTFTAFYKKNNRNNRDKRGCGDGARGPAAAAQGPKP